MTLSIDILDRLIAFDTVSDRSNLELIDYVDAFLTTRGFRTNRIADPVELKAGLFAEIGPGVDGGILLSAHSDVVPIDGQVWTKPPFKLMRDGDRLFGRGTTDMKGFLAEMLAVADLVYDKELKAPLKLLISYDEEVGCVGLARMSERLEAVIGRPRLAIVGEPTEMQVAIGHKGKRAYRALITGQAGHSALAPQFVSALLVAVDFVGTLRHLQENLRQTGARDADYDIPYSTVHVGQLQSGRALNIVPDRAEVLFEVRHLSGDDPDDIEKLIDQAMAAVTAAHDDVPVIDLQPLIAYPGLDVARSDAAVRAAQAWSGGQICKVAFGTEAGLLSEMGVPTIVLGPGSMAGQGHKSDEYIMQSQLEECSNMLAKAVEELL
ncbi:MAG: acetylornithine deacetylase [Pseudomonadota bacterium]